MKSLADFKRALTLGSEWQATYYRGDYSNSLGVRKVAKVMSNKVGFAREGKEGLSYLDFPRASEFEVNEKGEVLIYFPEVNEPGMTSPRSLVLTYKKIS